MERRAFLLSLGISLFTMYVVYKYVSGEDERLRQEYGIFFPMVVSTRNILQFETIQHTDLEVIRVPAAMVPPGLIADPRDIIDSIAAVPIARGEQVLSNKIISRNVYSGLDGSITLGKRAISIPVNAKNALGYHIRPGNRIDLAAHFEYKGGGTNISEVKIFLQDLLVLASGRTIQSTPPKGVDLGMLTDIQASFPDLSTPEAQEALNYAKIDPSYNTLTVEVTPFQAQIIVYVMTVFADALLVMLRHTDDRALDRVPTTNLIDVMGPESYLVRGRKLPPLRAIPRPKFFDLVGGREVAVPP